MRLMLMKQVFATSTAFLKLVSIMLTGQICLPDCMINKADSVLRNTGFVKQNISVKVCTCIFQKQILYYKNNPVYVHSQIFF